MTLDAVPIRTPTVFEDDATGGSMQAWKETFEICHRWKRRSSNFPRLPSRTSQAHSGTVAIFEFNSLRHNA